MPRNTLLYIDNPEAGEASVLQLKGRVVLRLSQHLLVAQLPPTAPEPPGTRIVREDGVPALPPEEQPLARAWWPGSRS